ncbi:glucosyltransferase domain-containing protein [Dyella jiangningensis]|uniref:Glycosyltransferase RgtA/B/C/D-like domain-containing protein n=1 Tax=Dyella jiangningensis TaxID=1379159 RepID=A0A328P8A2_9GAMM|nr:glucosyltransferase domain-containing protein [Dyella jiangningensis]RAO77900.1 hypothetical protein CA260_08660 [Dyella jiangningensis]
MTRVEGERTGLLAQEDLLGMSLLTVLVFLVYSAVLVNSFGVLDDYNFLYNAIRRNNDTVTLLLGAGRPLNAYLLDWGFRAAGSIEGLARLRAITLLGFALLASGLFVFVRRHGLSLVASFALAAGTVLLPSFQVYAAWAQHFTTPYAGLLALVAAYLLSLAYSPAGSLRMSVACKSALLLTMAVLIYQPMAMIFAVGVLISVVTSRQPMREYGFARLVVTGVVFAFAMVVGFVALKIGQHYHPNGSARYGLVSDFSGKAKWFFEEPLPNALSFFWVPVSKWGVWAVAAVMVLGYVGYARKHGMRQGGYVLIVSLGVVLVSYLPNLATAENWASYRSIGVLACALFTIAVLLAFVPLAGRLGMGDENRPLNARVALLAAVLLCLSVTAAGRVSRSFVQPNLMEINNLASLFKGRTDQPISRILIRPSSWMDSAANPVLYDEFGMQSSLDDHRATVIVDLARLSLNRFQGAELVPIAHDTPPGMAVGTSDIYVDFPALDTAGRFRSIRSHLKAPLSP